MEIRKQSAVMKKLIITFLLSTLVFACAAGTVSAAAATAVPVKDKSSGKLFFRNSDGSILKKKGLVKIGKYYYYLDSDYSCHAGFKKISKKYFYFSPTTGRRHERQGWKLIEGKKYYFKKDFSAATGTCTISGKKYLFTKKGVLARNKFGYEVNGNYYDSDINGFAKKIPAVQAECYSAAWNYINTHSSPSQSNYERYRSCFNYLESYLNFYSRPRSYYNFDDPSWPYVFALGVFESGLTGDCHGFASCMAVIGKLLGYKPTIFVAKDDHSFVIVEGKFIDNDWGGLFFSTRSHDVYTLDRMVTL